MRAVPGSHFTFEWNPTRGDLAVGDLANYYPGDAYVDYVGLDVYDVESQVYPGAKAEFSHMQTQAFGLDWLSSFAVTHHKQIVLPEWGLGWGTCSASGQPISSKNDETCGGDNATWVNLMAKLDRYAPRVRGHVLGLRHLRGVRTPQPAYRDRVSETSAVPDQVGRWPSGERQPEPELNSAFDYDLG